MARCKDLSTSTWYIFDDEKVKDELTPFKRALPNKKNKKRNGSKSDKKASSGSDADYDPDKDGSDMEEAKAKQEDAGAEGDVFETPNGQKYMKTAETKDKRSYMLVYIRKGLSIRSQVACAPSKFYEMYENMSVVDTDYLEKARRTECQPQEHNLQDIQQDNEKFKSYDSVLFTCLCACGYGLLKRLWQ